MLAGVTIQKLQANQATINLIFNTFSDKTFSKILDSGNKDAYSIYDLCRNFELGIMDFWTAWHCEDLVGLFHGHYMDDRQFQGHQLFYKPFWGEHAIQTEAVRMVGVDVFTNKPTCTQMTGYTPANLPLALKAAKRFGFEECGMYKDYYTYNDKKVDAVILRLEKDNCIPKNKPIFRLKEIRK